MALGLHLVPNMCDDTSRVDDERRTLDPEEGATIERFLLPDTVGVRDLAIDVGQQREGQRILLLELRVRGDAVRTHANDRRIDTLEARERIAELTRLSRAARRVILRIEIQHDRAATERLE